MQQDKRKKLDDDLSSPNIIGSKTNKQQLSVRTYLEQTVVPVLLQGLTVLVKTRPEDEDPVVFLANWLIENQKKNPVSPIPGVSGESESPVKEVPAEETPSPEIEVKEENGE